MDFRRNNILGDTAFTSYGLLWIGLALLNVLESLGIFETSPGELASWMAMWGIFTLYLTVAAAQVRARALTVVLALLTVLFFFLLLAGAFASGSTALTRRAGAWGLITGLSAVYTSAAAVINGTAGRQVLPA